MDKKLTMEGEKSEQGIVVNKLVRNAAKISDLPQVGKTDADPKGSVLMRSPSAHGRKAIRTYYSSCTKQKSTRQKAKELRPKGSRLFRA